MGDKAVPGFVDDVEAWEKWWSYPFRAKPDRINWRGPNLWSFFFVAACIAMSLTPVRPLYFGFMDHPRALGLLLFVNSGILVRTIKSYGYAIDAFKPHSALAAKRANEQIKLAATLINAGATAAISIYVLSEFLGHEEPNFTLISCAIGCAVIIHILARELLGFLKDEDKDTYRPATDAREP